MEKDSNSQKSFLQCLTFAMQFNSTALHSKRSLDGLPSNTLLKYYRINFLQVLQKHQNISLDNMFECDKVNQTCHSYIMFCTSSCEVNMAAATLKPEKK